MYQNVIGSAEASTKLSLHVIFNMMVSAVIQNVGFVPKLFDLGKILLGDWCVSGHGHEVTENDCWLISLLLSSAFIYFC